MLQCNWPLLSHGVRFQPSFIPAPSLLTLLAPLPPLPPSLAFLPPLDPPLDAHHASARPPPPPPRPLPHSARHCWSFSLQFKLTLSSFPSLHIKSTRRMVRKNTFNYDTDTQYVLGVGGGGDPLCHATKRHLTDKRLKTMKNERKIYLFLFFSAWKIDLFHRF